MVRRMENKFYVVMKADTLGAQVGKNAFRSKAILSSHTVIT